SPLLESGTGRFGQTIMNVAFDEHGHGSASLTTTNPFNGAVSTLTYRLPTPVQDGDVVLRGHSGLSDFNAVPFGTA
ncbi:MAG TPA: hypothetical protein VKP69_14195, partial [Isosphaeraceae bacterium]|nr:hypothetical protein [Isosphaeraceae bacterium]